MMCWLIFAFYFMLSFHDLCTPLGNTFTPISLQCFKDLYLTAPPNRELLAPRASTCFREGDFGEVPICKARAEENSSSVVLL